MNNITIKVLRKETKPNLKRLIYTYYLMIWGIYEGLEWERDAKVDKGFKINELITVYREYPGDNVENNIKLDDQYVKELGHSTYL